MKSHSPGFAAFLLLFALSAGGQTLQFSSETYTAAEAIESFVTLTVIRSGPTSGTTTVQYSTGDFPPDPSSATASKDYEARTGTLTFGPAETMKQISIRIIQDFPAVHEPTQVFYVTLSNPTGATLRAPSTAEVHITEDNYDWPPEMEFSSTTYSVNEGAGFVVLTLTKKGATEARAVVYLSTSDWTAMAPSDYPPIAPDFTVSVTFEPSETTKQIQIPINDDGLKEWNETFSVGSYRSSHAYLPVGVDVTIIDNDPEGPQEPPVQPLNISTRSKVQTGDGVMIGGFIVTGNDPKRLVLRGLGPSLANGFIPANLILVDPVLQLNRADGSVIAANDNWKDDSTTQAEIAGSSYQPQDDREAVIVVTLPPGAYTASVRGKGSNTGIALVEIYDTSPGANAALANISTRSSVGTNFDVMIGGFILGNNPGPTRVAVRALGPSLSSANLNGVLADPTVEIRDANGGMGFFNDDWQSDSDSAAQLTAHGLAPRHASEAGLVVGLPPGQFTAIVRGKNASAGIGLVEIYNLH